MRNLFETLLRSCAGLTPDEKVGLAKALLAQAGEQLFTQAEVDAKITAYWKEVEMKMRDEEVKKYGGILTVKATKK